MPVFLSVECGGKHHDIVITDDHEMIPLDHDLEEELGAAAMGARKPQCLEWVEWWEMDKQRTALEFMAFVEGRQNFFRLLAAYAEHVLWMWEGRFPEDQRPREAIAAMREAAQEEDAGKREDILRSLHDQLSLDVAVEGGRRRYSSRSNRAAYAAGDVAKLSLIAAYGFGFSPMDSMETAMTALRLARTAKGEVYGWPWAEAESRWQIDYFLAAVEAIREGRPWPAPGNVPERFD